VTAEKPPPHASVAPSSAFQIGTLGNPRMRCLTPGVEPPPTQVRILATQSPEVKQIAGCINQEGISVSCAIINGRVTLSAFSEKHPLALSMINQTSRYPRHQIYQLPARIVTAAICLKRPEVLSSPDCPRDCSSTSMVCRQMEVGEETPWVFFPRHLQSLAIVTIYLMTIILPVAWKSPALRRTK
jgi:hypothetical protein